MATKKNSNKTRSTETEENGKRAGDSAPEVETDWSSLRADAVDRMIQDLESKFWDKDFRASVGDYIRLIQIRKELEEERPKEITVTWVEPSGENDATA